jgi:hypothetical protein
VYADGQILAQKTSNGVYYHYIHDRLGNIRLVVDVNGIVKNSYTYNPFGEVIESGSSDEPPAPSNCFMFTGQWWDYEIGQ